MACRSSIVAAAFLLAGTLSVAFAASNVEKIRNEKVIVLEEVLAPGEAEANSVPLPSMVVYMAGNGATIQRTQ